MAIKTSTGLRDAMLDTESFKAAMDGGFLKIYAGTVPATADAALGGATLLCTLTESDDGVTGLTFGSATSGVIPKNSGEVWSGTNSGSGTATFYRFVTAADDGTLSTSQERVQGTVAVLGGDMDVSSTTFTAAAVFTLDTFNIALPTN